MSNEPDLQTSRSANSEQVADPGNTVPSGDTVPSGTAAAKNRKASQVPRLLVERELLSVKLAARTAQLQAALRELHDANVELGKLTGRESPTAAAIDWDTILESNPPD